MNVVEEELFVDLRHDQIENWNDISWVAFDLSVELGIELVDMVTVNIQNVNFSLFDTFELVNVEGCLSEIIAVFVNNHESVNEVLHFDLHFICVDVCSP